MEEVEMDKVFSLDQDWKLFLLNDTDVMKEITSIKGFEDNAIPAHVPGDWVLDYVEQGLVEDPYYQDHYLRIQEYETYHVFYSLEFNTDLQPTGRETILFEGIDTVADVYLNGEKIGHAENMYIPHIFPALSLKTGKNELFVHILPCVLEARKYPIDCFSSAIKYNYESLVIRKAAHMFSWDICPRIVTSGLWRSVSLIQAKEKRITDAFIWIDKLDMDGTAHCMMMFDTDIGRDAVSNYTIRVEGVCKDSCFTTGDTLWYPHRCIRFDISNPRLWWPRGYGDPNLYSITVTLLKNGEPVDSIMFEQGLRTVELIRDDVLDKDGQGDFCFIINGKRIFVMGSNWVPADAFHSNDDNRIQKILDLVVDIGCNTLRVWGGGVYESDAFYQRCDKEGILVWQDFMMACGIYPHTERMQTQLKEEASAIVKRLRKYACICLWAGDNECDQNYCWFELKQDPTDNILTRKIIPDVLRHEDMTRPYLPSSPYVSHEAYLQGKFQETPEQHLWGPRDYFKSPFYHDATAVFASEIGYHGCNSPESLYRFIGMEQAWPVDNNPMYLYHCASPELEGSPYTYRISLMSHQLNYLFDKKPDNLHDYARMSQISQAEATKYFIESFRSRKGKRTGIIWWNIMDCWPQISDAVVDYYFCKKLAYFYIRRSQQPVCLMADDYSGSLILYGINEIHQDIPVNYQVVDMDTKAIVMAGKKVLKADASTQLAAFPKEDGRHFYAISWNGINGLQGTNHFLKGSPPYSYAWYMKHLKEMGYDEFEGFGKE